MILTPSKHNGTTQKALTGQSNMAPRSSTARLAPAVRRIHLSPGPLAVNIATEALQTLEYLPSACGTPTTPNGNNRQAMQDKKAINCRNVARNGRLNVKSQHVYAIMKQEREEKKKR